MKIKVKVLVEKEFNIKTISVTAPFYKEDLESNGVDLTKLNIIKEDRNKLTLRFSIDVDTGCILDWPSNFSCNIFGKVCDSGVYVLFDEKNYEIAKIKHDYVPNELIPGSDGDYIDLQIDSTGKITNWPKYPSFGSFFNRE